MNEEKQKEEKNCKECLHFEACCKWTDFPKQIGFPVCRKFTPTNTPTNTNLHQPCKSVQVEEMIKVIEKCSCAYTPCDSECAQCSNVEMYEDNINHIARTLYNAGYRKQSEVIDDFVKRLLDAFPEPHRGGNLCPAIYYDDYSYIIEELAEKMKGGE